MAAHPESLEFDFDPLASSEFLGSFIRGLDYEQRRQLTARGEGGGSGGSRRPSGSGRRGSGRRPSPQTRIGGVLRSIVWETEKSARARLRAAKKAAKEAAYASRVYQRSAAARIREQARRLTREARQTAREAARERRALAHALIRPPRRTPYQRRVVSGVTRQIERGERPSIARAVESERARVARLTNTQAIEQIKLRLRQMFPNSENYDNSFWQFDSLPEMARALLPLSDNNLWQLAHANPKTANDPLIFLKELTQLTKQDLLSLPVVISGNPLFYHDAAARVQYGI
jgi:hypothetical protein